MIIPYLTFRGDCEEAMNRYVALFGGQINGLSRFTAETGSPALVGKIMHMEATVGNGTLSGSDQEEPVDHGSAISLMVHFDTQAEAEKCFDALAEEGQALQRLTPHPPPDDGGMGAFVKDKYGYSWILTAPNDRKGL